MKSLQRIAFIGNHLPHRCGIATFTNDLHRAVSMARSDLETGVVAMTDPGGVYDYPQAVRLAIQDENIDEYERTRDHLGRPLFETAERLASQEWDDHELDDLVRRISSINSEEVELLAGLDHPAARGAR